MRSERIEGTRRNAAVISAVLAATFVLGAGLGPAHAKPGLGFVDPAPFDELAGDDDLVVYVSIGDYLLSAIGSALRGQDQELADAVTRLESVQMVIVDISKPEKKTAGHALMRKTLRDLARSRWERLAVVREEDVELSVMIRGTKETVDGLVVLIEEKTDQQLIFVNIAGRIDLAKLEAIGREMEIPGLDQVPKER